MKTVKLITPLKPKFAKLTPFKPKLNRYEEENAKQKYISIRHKKVKSSQSLHGEAKKTFPFRRLTLNTQS